MKNVKKKKIGIHKSTVLTVCIGVMLFIAGILVIFSVAGYQKSYPLQRLYESGWEVEAEIVEVTKRITRSSDNIPTSHYYTHYYYKSESVVEYTGKVRDILRKK